MNSLPLSVNRVGHQSTFALPSNISILEWKKGMCSLFTFRMSCSAEVVGALALFLDDPYHIARIHEFIFSKISITYHYLIISVHISIGNE